jgi:PAS domain S-box-containing protein
MNDIIWTMGLDFNFTYVSPSVERILGFTQEERMSQEASKRLTPESLARSYDHLNAGLKYMQKKGADPERKLKFELEYYHKNGSTVWMETVASFIRDDTGKVIGIHGVSRDITDRKQVEEALRQSEAKYRFLTEKMNDIIWTMGLDFRITYGSPSFKKVLGFTPEERMSMEARERITPESLARAQDALLAGLKYMQEKGVDPERSVTLELECYHKNGSIVWMECIVSPIVDKTGKITGIHGVSRDITKRKQVEKELKKYREQLEDLVKERTAELSGAYEQLKQENEVRKTTELALRSRESELEKERKEVNEVNAALKVLLKHREEDKANMEMDIISNIKISVLPYVEKLEASRQLEQSQKAALSQIKSHLNDIASPFVRKISSEYLGLTPTEIKVASLIKEGRSSKDIAELLNISLNTVITHRYSIRKKTGLKNKKVNLRSYLQVLE